MTNGDLWVKLDSFFSHHEEQLSMFLAVERMVNSIGPASVEIRKSQISFGTKTKFAWVSLPQPWTKKLPESSIVLTFGIGRFIQNNRLIESQEPYPGQWTHQLIIQNETDLNKEVFTWLCEAYTFSLIRGRNTKATFQIPFRAS